MESSGKSSELDRQAPSASTSNVPNLPNADAQEVHEKVASTDEHNEPRSERQDTETQRFQIAGKDFEHNAADHADDATDDQTACENASQALTSATDDGSRTMFEQAREPAAAPQLHEDARQTEVTVNETHKYPAEIVATDPASNGLDRQQTQPHAGDIFLAEHAPLLPEYTKVQISPQTPEKLRGNPYMLAASHGASKDMPEGGGQHAFGNYRQAEDDNQSKFLAPTVDDEPRVALEDSGHGDEEEWICDQGSEGDSVISENEDEEDGDEMDEDGEDQVAQLGATVQQNAARARPTWSQRHKLSQDDYDFEGHTSDQGQAQQAHSAPEVKDEPGFNPYIDYSHPSHQYAPTYARSNHPSMFDSIMSSAMDARRHHGQYMHAQQSPTGMLLSHSHPAAGMPPTPYLGTVGMDYRHIAYGAPGMNMPYGQYPQSAYGMMPPHPAATPQPPHDFSMYEQAYMPSHARNGPGNRRTAPSQPLKHRRAPPQVVDEHDCGNMQESDDDEPLRTRIQRHPSATSDSVIGSSSPPVTNNKRGRIHAQDENSDIEFVSSKPSKKKMANPPGTRAATRTPPQSSSTVNADIRDSSSSENKSIDWKLPTFDAQFEPGKTKNDPTVAKISIPNLVREELLLSPDHSDQETHLLLNVFLPAQQARPYPDPEPAAAVLNFHTIAVMVIEASVQFEIGDEFGMGRGHWHDKHDQGDEEYERVRSVTEADPDEIFFAVVDRWRAGIESNKQPSKLIRGAQEFCDTALDIIYYVKENGLVKERQRAVRSDKGVKRGAKTIGGAEGGAEQKGKGKAKTAAEGEKEGGKIVTGRGGGVKRGTTVNTVEARKKAKTAAPKAKEKPKKKKRSEPGLTVIKRT
ncbi:hypothetical protein EK21DRAFT_119209 [Setomelanomma holmii]|uniref:Uncharacterized protein n=1 Tax=Setomelanomma holmii TaxID=210430 RepID=A0A9P4GWY9_9PLEO|nr:hypothetical protein EK21DRAFT_119209 [Setomelanomma holmii]